MDPRIKSGGDGFCLWPTLVRGPHSLIVMPGLDPGIHGLARFGEITERGTHQSLLAATGPYAALWAKQQKEKDQEIPVPTG